MIPNGNQTVCAGATYETWTNEQEMASFDRLGPLTQRALRTLPLKVGATGILIQALQQGADPKSPPVDNRIAAVVTAQIRECIALDREPEEAMRRDFEFRRVRRRRIAA